MTRPLVPLGVCVVTDLGYARHQKLFQKIYANSAGAFIKTCHDLIVRLSDIVFAYMNVLFQNLVGLFLIKLRVGELRNGNVECQAQNMPEKVMGLPGIP